MSNWIAAVLVGALVIGGIYLIKGNQVSANPTGYLPTPTSKELIATAEAAILEYTQWEEFVVEEAVWVVDESEKVSLLVATTHNRETGIFLLYIELGGDQITGKVVRRIE